MAKVLVLIELDNLSSDREDDVELFVVQAILRHDRSVSPEVLCVYPVPEEED